ncbi:MAG: hypothetical protein WAM26_03890 [Nitrososphaeraceae archaeon]
MAERINKPPKGSGKVPQKSTDGTSKRTADDRNSEGYYMSNQVISEGDAAG